MYNKIFKHKFDFYQKRSVLETEKNLNNRKILEMIHIVNSYLRYQHYL